jgi:hypothetical protein
VETLPIVHVAEQWRAAQTKEKEKGKGNSLSTFHVAEQWRAAQTKEKGKRNAAVMD